LTRWNDTEEKIEHAGNEERGGRQSEEDEKTVEEKKKQRKKKTRETVRVFLSVSFFRNDAIEARKESSKFSSLILCLTPPLSLSLPASMHLAMRRLLFFVVALSLAGALPGVQVRDARRKVLVLGKN
jgi:hypothetical protein